jgi:uncharacterized oxidoreductase
MKLQQQTVLITGGSSGIGLELAKQLMAKNNKVIICGRSAENLKRAQSNCPQLHTIQCDISIDTDRYALVEWIKVNHADLSILVNNAAIVHKTDFQSDPDIIEKADAEIKTNLLAPIALAKLFLPLLEQKKSSAIINITTGLVYAPRAVYPIYNATKAALHSFTQVLRQQMKKSSIKVIEVMMPVVDTPWHKGDVPKIAIPVSKAVNEMISKVESDKLEIRIGAVRILYVLSRIAPAFAFRKINQIK